MYRFWTGTAWTSAITPNPQSAPPPQAPGQSPTGQPAGSYGQATTGYGPATGYGQGSGYGAGPGNGQGSGYGQGSGGQPSRRSRSWWVGGAAILVAVALLAWLAFAGISRLMSGQDPLSGQPTSGSNPSQDICPKVASDAATTPPPQRNDGRVHGGKISYPALGSPWSEVRGDNRVPFGREVAEQIVLVEENYDGQSNDWVASILVGELVAGDGFFSPQEGSEIVMRCVVGEFYADAVVQRDDRVSKAMTVDGHDAWIVESHLSFNISGLKTTGELAIVVIVDTGAESSSLYYASIPDTVPDLVGDARTVLKELTVD